MDRHTSQRIAIEASLRSAQRPLSPAEILDWPSTIADDQSRHGVPHAQELTEGGLIRAVELPGEPSRYELAGLPHHHHFKCDECDRVYDVPGKCPSGLADGLPSGFRVRDHEVVLVGTCAECSPHQTTAPQGRSIGDTPVGQPSPRPRSGVSPSLWMLLDSGVPGEDFQPSSVSEVQRPIGWASGSGLPSQNRGHPVAMPACAAERLISGTIADSGRVVVSERPADSPRGALEQARPPTSAAWSAGPGRTHAVQPDRSPDGFYSSAVSEGRHTMSKHANHPHQHGPNCGHTAVKHAGHVDYLHDGHLHHANPDGTVGGAQDRRLPSQPRLVLWWKDRGWPRGRSRPRSELRPRGGASW
jgi:Fur family ferric uptake transcriptional regulator